MVSLFLGVFIVLALSLVAVGTAAAKPASFAVFRPPSGQWFIFNPVDGFRQETWGCGGCGSHFPVPADYDGDGEADVAIFSVARVNADPFVPNTRFIPLQSAAPAGLSCANCVPVPHDYDGDGKAEFAVFDATTNQWTIRATSPSGEGDEVHLPFGCAGCGDVPVPARFTAISPATPPLFRPFALPNAGSAPVGITAGPDGNLWFTERAGNRIGNITPAGVITEFPLPTAGSGPTGIVSGPDGNLWFTERDGNRIGKVTPAGVITEFTLPTAGSGPFGITTGPDGNLWFTERDGDRVGYITPAGVITEFTLPTAGSAPTGIVSGPDGNLWFTETGGNRIGRIAPDGTIAEFVVPTVGGAPTDITSGPDGNLWFTESGNSRLGRIAPDGTRQDFILSPSPNVHLSRITTGPDGQLWVKGAFALPPSGSTPGRYVDVVWQVAVSGQILREFRPAPSTADGSDVGAITTGPDGRIWFVQPHLDRIGSVSVNTPFTGIAMYRRTTGEWLILEPTGQVRVAVWGCPTCGDVPVARDYDGDGIADLAVYRPATAEWFIFRSSDGGVTHVTFGGGTGDTAVPADYDGDGKADIAVYRAGTGEWFVLRSTDGGLTQVQFGCSSCGDVPVPAVY
ncbi:MAG TPA: FG-GAP-like repeat-containing protein [Candidatus Acidoferrum sp.]|nr:FG-GAP-like repeat-containing protein [Candidatus Acidoferrum sp.]